jgi:hypothetical protein
MDAGANDTSSIDGSGGDDATGTGGSVSDAGRADGSTADAGSGLDAGAFVCGETLCNQAEVCVHQACGCVVVKPDDAGVCAGDAGLTGAGYCVPTCEPPYCWSPDDGTSLECDGTDGGLSGIFNSLPPGTDLVCDSPCL